MVPKSFFLLFHSVYDTCFSIVIKPFLTAPKKYHAHHKRCVFKSYMWVTLLMYHWSHFILSGFKYYVHALKLII